jgi:hypothetical protein
MSQPIISSTTQNFLDIYDITNDLVILRDGTTTLIITVDAMNFGLLAEEEQDSIIYSYAGLLNSLNYPIQIIINSQTKDVTGYLHLLKDQEDETTNPKMRQRIKQYREFVANLIRERNVLDKRFYLAIPATALELGLLTPQSVMPGTKTLDITGIERNVILEKAQTVLEPKRDHLIAQFARIGLFSRQLTTQEIIQLFYISYNPEAAEGQQLVDTSNYVTPLVTTGAEGNIMTNSSQPPFDPQNQGVQPTQPALGGIDSYQPTQMVTDAGQPAQPLTADASQPAQPSALDAANTPAEPAPAAMPPMTDLNQTMSNQPQIEPEPVGELHTPDQPIVQPAAPITPITEAAPMAEVTPTSAVTPAAEMAPATEITPAPEATPASETTPITEMASEVAPAAPESPDIQQIQQEIDQTLGQFGATTTGSASPTELPASPVSVNPPADSLPNQPGDNNQAVSIPTNNPVGNEPSSNQGDSAELPEI